VIVGAGKCDPVGHTSTGRHLKPIRLHGDSHPNLVAHGDLSTCQAKALTMRTFELRVYTMRTNAALDFYIGAVFPRHLDNFPWFGIKAHGIWTAKDEAAAKAFVLVSYAEGDDPVEVAQRYLQSPEAATDARGFDHADILHVDSTVLIPAAGSSFA
jgi:hypothetical protein